MKALNQWYPFITFMITWGICCCSAAIASSPTPKINETKSNVSVEVILQNKTVLTHESVELVCKVRPESSVLAIKWSKGNETIRSSRRLEVRKHTVLINDTIASDSGYYTCSVTTTAGIQNRTAFLMVIESEDDEDIAEEKDNYSGDQEEEFPCGRPEAKEISTCMSYNGFPNCESFAPALDINDINITQMLVWPSDTENRKPISVDMEIQWKLPITGNSDIWGWQVMIVDVGRHLNRQLCVQINRKYLWRSSNGDRYANYTLPRHFVSVGTKLQLYIQSLPSMGMAMAKNVAKKTIFTKGYCYAYPESHCCYRAKDLVIKQVDKTSVHLSLPNVTAIDLSFFSGFEVIYKSMYKNGAVCYDNAIELSIEDFLKNSSIIVLDLQPQCVNYSVKITPIYSESNCASCDFICDSRSKRKLGKASQLYYFQVSTDTGPHPSTLNNLFKALIIVLVLLILSVFLILGIIYRRKRHALEKNKELDTVPKERPAVEVFIAHGGHCRDCDDAVLAVATYLNMTGHCKCYLDLCSLPKEWSPGTSQYYETQISKRQKVIVLFTAYQNEECEETIKARNFTYQKNLIRSELLTNCPTTKFIPVYMDFLSDLDIPSFLRNKKSFSLPSQLLELVLYIIGEPLCKPVSVCPVVSLEEDSSLLKQKKILEAKIKDLNAKHQKNMKNKNNNFLAKIV